MIDMIVISPNGLETNPGTIDEPTTFESAISQDPDKIIFRGGTYLIKDRWIIKTPGTFENYLNETVVLDYSESNLDSWQGAIDIRADDVTLRGLRITNSPRRGIIQQANRPTVNLLLEDISIDNIKGTGLIVNADNCTVRNCIIHRTNLGNKHFVEDGKGGWGIGFKTSRESNLTPLKNLLIEGCKVSEIYGEGIGLSHTIGATVRNNKVWNVASTGIYAIAVQETEIYANEIRADDKEYYRAYVTPMNGISFATESASYTPPGGVSGKAYKNYVSGCKTGINFWYAKKNPEAGYKSLEVFDNVIPDWQQYAIRIDEVPAGVVQPESGILRNNYTGQKPSAVYIGNPDKWQTSQSYKLTDEVSIVIWPTNE